MVAGTFDNYLLILRYMLFLGFVDKQLLWGMDVSPYHLFQRIDSITE